MLSSQSAISLDTITIRAHVKNMSNADRKRSLSVQVWKILFLCKHGQQQPWILGNKVRRI